MAAVRVTLLGGATLVSDAHRVERMERKSAALVAFLALGGASVRTRAAGMLWPESPEKTARNNLAQTVRRLREAAGASVVEGDQTIALAAEVDVDVARIEVLVQRGQTADAAKNRGVLLDGFDFDDCKELADWLAGQRERMRRALKRACAAEAERLEREGRIDDALARTRADLEADPLDEEATRRRMRLLYRTGDTAEALRVYDEFVEILERDLGALPHADTEALADAIRDGIVPSQRASQLPSMRAPLVGRRAVWTKLEEAWKQRAGILIVGPAGIGKTRIATEFAASKGVAMRTGARPGDAAVPYATSARFFKQIATRPSIKLPEWARGELARIVPSLGAATQSSGSDFDKVRFFAAMSETLRRAVNEGLSILCFDDVQFIDAASFDAFEHVFSAYWSGESSGLKTLLTARPNMEDALAARIARGEQTKLLTRVVLDPLDAAAVEELLGHERALEGRASEVHAIAAGNPFFVLEIMKGVQSGELDTKGSLAHGKRAAELVAQRLEPLSSAALRLARVAAIAGSEMDLTLAAAVLETSPLDLAEPLSELATAEIMDDMHFTHDLLQEIVYAKTPAAVRAFVHERVAMHLASRDAEPARAAEHFFAAGKPDQATPLFEQAGRRAQSLSRLTEAATFYERAADHLEARGELPHAFALLGEVRRFARQLAPERIPSIVEHFARLATTDGDRARVMATSGFLALYRGKLTEASERLEQTVAHDLDWWGRAEARQLQFFIHLHRNELEAAEAERARFMEAATALDHYEGKAVVFMHDAQIRVQRDEHADAVRLIGDMLGELEKHSTTHWALSRGLALRAHSLLVLGRANEAQAALVTATPRVSHFPRNASARNELAIARVEYDVATGALAEAARVSTDIVREVPDEPWLTIPCRIALALIAASEARRADALALLERAAKDGSDLPTYRAAALVARTAIDDASSNDDARYVERYASPLDIARFAMRTRPRDLALATTMHDLATRHGARGYLAEATAALAVAKNDRDAMREATELAAAYPPMNVVPGAISRLKIPRK